MSTPMFRFVPYLPPINPPYFHTSFQPFSSVLPSQRFLGPPFLGPLASGFPPYPPSMQYAFYPGYFPNNLYYSQAVPVGNNLSANPAGEAVRTTERPQGRADDDDSNLDEYLSSSEENFTVPQESTAPAVNEDLTAQRPSASTVGLPMAQYSPNPPNAQVGGIKLMAVPELIPPVAEQPSLLRFLRQWMNEHAALLLIMSVEWAVNVPSLTSLTQAEQESLVLSTWRELFILSAAQHSVTNDEERTSPSARSRRDQPEEYRLFSSLIANILKQNINTIEYAYLKKALLFRSDVLMGYSSHQVDFARERVLAELHHYCITNNALVRFGKLVLLLPAVSCLASDGRLDRLLFAETYPPLQVEQIIREVMRKSIQNRANSRYVPQ